MPQHPPNVVKEMLARSQGQTQDLAKAYLQDRAATGKLTSKVHSRALLLMWVGGIALAAFICFTVANTIGRALLGLEESLDHHQRYLEEPVKDSNKSKDS